MQNEKVTTKHLILLSLLLATPVLGQSKASTSQTSVVRQGLKEAGIKNLDLNIDSSYSSMSSDTDKFSRFETNINIDLEANIASGLDFDFDGGFKYQSGNSSTQEQGRAAEFKPKFTYNYGYFNYKILNFAKINFGALNNSSSQQFISPFINGGNSFIGAREVAIQKFGNLYVRLQATQARPENRILKETFNVDDSGSPSFFNESIDLTYLTSGMKLYSAVGSYRYFKLSADVADNDYYWGNSVSKGAAADQSLYYYDYTGMYANAGVLFRVGEDKMKVFGSYVNNQDAPTGKNTGYLYGANYETKIAGSKISLEALAFRNEADTAPAFYRANTLSNDYEGYQASLAMTGLGGFSADIKYTNRTVIGNEDSVYLINGYSDEQVYSISLRKEYDIL